MLDKETLVKITNRDNGSVGYYIPEMNVRRSFESGETKEISMQELRQLSWTPGGDVLLKEYFILNNEDAVNELISGGVEPEYYYTEEDIKKLLLTGSLDELKDCLDFAPEGTINLLKKLAVDLKINDLSKREAIKQATNFDVNKAIEVNEETKEDNNKDEQKKRRVSAITATSSEGRIRRVIKTTQK